MASDMTSYVKERRKNVYDAYEDKAAGVYAFLSSNTGQAMNMASDMTSYRKERGEGKIITIPMKVKLLMPMNSYLAR